MTSYVIITLSHNHVSKQKIVEGFGCYDSILKGLSKELTLVLSDTRELDRVPNTK